MLCMQKCVLMPTYTYCGPPWQALSIGVEIGKGRFKHVRPTETQTGTEGRREGKGERASGGRSLPSSAQVNRGVLKGSAVPDEDEAKRSVLQRLGRLCIPPRQIATSLGAMAKTGHTATPV